MSGARLAAVALRQVWRLPKARPGREWQRPLEELVAAVALDCEAAGAVVIGHVKALAAWPEGGYVRASAVDTRHGPSAESTAMGVARESELTLNVLVYGLADEVVVGLATSALTRLATTVGAQVTPCAPSAGGHVHVYPASDEEGRKQR